MKELNLYGWIALAVVIVGGIDHGIAGLIGIDILGATGWLGRLIFIGIGVAAGYLGYLYYMEKLKDKVDAMMKKS